MRTKIPIAKRLQRERYGGRFGGYRGFVSRTLFDRPDFQDGFIEINLTWWIRFRWHFRVELFGYVNGTPYSVVDQSNVNYYGLDWCSYIADQAAKKLLAAQGLDVQLAPYKFREVLLCSSLKSSRAISPSAPGGSR